MNVRCAWIVTVVLVMVAVIVRAADVCEVCGKTIEGPVYMWEDKVANVSRRVCSNCIALPKTCYMCSLPVARDYTELPDGRVLCARDAKTVVLDESEALRLCKETQTAMDSLFSRFTSFPEDNVTISLVDRVNLIALFRFPGRDYTCPNVLGYIESKTNNNQVTHEISLMTGMPRVTVKSTFVHERTHAWIAENVPAKRKEHLDGDAEEGFCELVSYMVMDAEGEESGKQAIKLNGYTRGQIDLYLEAEQRFGFNDIVDWMKYGVDSRLRADDLGRVRDVEMPIPKIPSRGDAVIYYSNQQVEKPPEFDSLVLKGLIQSGLHPQALINDNSFAPGQKGRVRVRTNTVTIRCLEIGDNFVRIRNMDTGQELELKLMER
jgi:Protein DA1